jgi:AAA+ superfamily predicted ATPase
MKKQITNYIRAGYPGVFIVSSEESRVEAMLKIIAQEMECRLFAWSATDGLLDLSGGTAREAPGPLEVISLVSDLPEKSLVLLRDFHLFLEEANPVLIRAVKDALRAGKTATKSLLVLGCRFALPPELAREFVRVDFSLPDKDELAMVLDNIAASAEQSPPRDAVRNALLDAACGLTSLEAENAFSLSVVESGRLTPGIVSREKANEVKKDGLLEICPAAEQLNDIGGLEELKAWLQQRKNSFSREAQAYGLPNPKGLLIVGVPGTGKSMTAKATAMVFDLPLLKLDLGRVFAGLVGQSETNLRSVIATVEAIAPCTLWLDEIEKGFSGSKSSGVADGGTASRVFGTFLSWMQDRKAPIFIVATANDVTQLPPELLRKGRFDELFFVDLPNQLEREAIWRIQIARYQRVPGGYDIERLAAATNGWTGAEIEQLFVEALHQAFNKKEEPTDLSIMLVLHEAAPLSKLMGEQIEILRKWAKGRARFATKPTSEKTGRKILSVY